MSETGFTPQDYTEFDAPDAENESNDQIDFELDPIDQVLDDLAETKALIPKEQMQQLITRVQANDQTAKNELLEALDPMIERILQKIIKPEIGKIHHLDPALVDLTEPRWEQEMEELTQVAHLAVLESAKGYDSVKRSGYFTRVAYVRVLNSTMDFLYANSGIGAKFPQIISDVYTKATEQAPYHSDNAGGSMLERDPFSPRWIYVINNMLNPMLLDDSTDRSAPEELQAESEKTGEAGSILARQVADKDQVRDAMAELKSREQQVIKLRFGLDGEYPRTREEIGQLLNVTSERVGQIEKNSLIKMQHQMGRAMIAAIQTDGDL